MNRQQAINSQGMPSYVNAIKSNDPKYETKMFNGKPQFRIRKRNDSAKNGIIKYNAGKKANRSLKGVQKSQADTIDNEDEETIGGYGDDSMTGSMKRLDDVNNKQIIGRLQSKYSIGMPPGVKTKKRKPESMLGYGNGIRKTYSNTSAPIQDSLVKMNSMSDKYNKLPLKKKFSNQRKLPEISQPKGMLPKIKS
jgi:hypothetical protein